MAKKVHIAFNWRRSAFNSDDQDLKLDGMCFYLTKDNIIPEHTTWKLYDVRNRRSQRECHTFAFEMCRVSTHETDLLSEPTSFEVRITLSF